MSHSSLTMKVKAGPGADIMVVAQQMCDLATVMQIDVECEFNDVKCIAQPNAEVAELIGNYWLASSGTRTTKLAFAYSRPKKDSHA